MNDSTYYLEWSEEGRRNRMVSNHKILIYGDISTHEMRYAVMKACKCKVDAISTNHPLSLHVQQVSQQIWQNSYSIVIIAESADQLPANCEFISTLQKRHPHTQFILATAPALWLHSARYRSGESAKKVNNQQCRQYASTHNIPLMDMEQWMLQRRLTDISAASRIKSRLAMSYLQQLRLSKAYKTLKLEKTEKSIARCCNIYLAQLAGNFVKNFCRKKISTPDTLWRNSWQHPEATALLIGDSNMRALCRANMHLTNAVDMYATSYPMLSDDNIEHISRHLHPCITHVVFSFGAHYIQAQNDDALEDRLRAFFRMLQDGARKVLVLTTTPWALKNDYSVEDKDGNKIIRELNSQIIRAAKDSGIELLDLYQLLANAPHSDYVHFSQESYTIPAEVLERWTKGNSLHDILLGLGLNESC